MSSSSDGHQTLKPKLLLQACKAMSAVGVPMYITETGVADHRDVLREEMFATYFSEAGSMLPLML